MSIHPILPRAAIAAAALVVAACTSDSTSEPVALSDPITLSGPSSATVQRPAAYEPSSPVVAANDDVVVVAWRHETELVIRTLDFEGNSLDEPPRVLEASEPITHLAISSGPGGFVIVHNESGTLVRTMLDRAGVVADQAVVAEGIFSQPYVAGSPNGFAVLSFNCLQEPCSGLGQRSSELRLFDADGDQIGAELDLGFEGHAENPLGFHEGSYYIAGFPSGRLDMDLVRVSPDEPTVEETTTFVGILPRYKYILVPIEADLFIVRVDWKREQVGDVYLAETTMPGALSERLIVQSSPFLPRQAVMVDDHLALVGHTVAMPGDRQLRATFVDPADDVIETVSVADSDGRDDTSVASLPNGQLVAAWSQETGERAATSRILVASLDRSSVEPEGQPISSERLEDCTDCSVRPIEYALDASGGGFLMAWRREGTGMSATEMVYRLFDNELVPRTEPIMLEREAGRAEYAPSVSYSSGQYLVVWHSEQAGVVGARIDSDGVASEPFDIPGISAVYLEVLPDSEGWIVQPATPQETRVGFGGSVTGVSSAFRRPVTDSRAVVDGAELAIGRELTTADEDDPDKCTETTTIRIRNVSDPQGKWDLPANGLIVASESGPCLAARDQLFDASIEAIDGRVFVVWGHWASAQSVYTLHYAWLTRDGRLSEPDPIPGPVDYWWMTYSPDVRLTWSTGGDVYASQLLQRADTFAEPTVVATGASVPRVTRGAVLDAFTYIQDSAIKARTADLPIGVSGNASGSTLAR